MLLSFSLPTPEGPILWQRVTHSQHEGVRAKKSKLKNAADVLTDCQGILVPVASAAG